LKSLSTHGLVSGRRPLHYVLVIPDGTGIRNFFCTPFIDFLLESGDVHVWHGLPASSVEPFRAQWGDRVLWSELPTLRDGFLERLARQSKGYAQIYWQRRTRGEAALRLKPPPSRILDRAVQRLAKIVGVLFSGSRRIVLLDRAHRSLAAKSRQIAAYREFLERASADVVFCSHQKSLRAVPVMLAARSLDIPTATFIYSWDNLPKGRMPVHADQFFVWSDFMKAELLSYYPDVEESRVRVVGTPQFENYGESPLVEPRSAFFKRLNLAPDRPVVCFSGDDPSCSPYDPRYLRDLAESLRRVPAGERPQLVFRRSPVDWSDRYDSVLRDFPEVVVSDPLWLPFSEKDWSQVVPTREDVALLLNLVHHADVVVNLGSTMAMDFAALGKPGIYVAYSPVTDDPNWRAEDVYKRPHFKSVHELQPIYWARSPEELGRLVLHAIRNPQEKSPERAAWLRRHVLQPFEGASERFAGALKELALGRDDVFAMGSAHGERDDRATAR
jgi:hypothetical protein